MNHLQYIARYSVFPALLGLIAAGAAYAPVTYAAPVCIVFSNNLYVGVSNNDVLSLQNFLAQGGYFTHTSTGYFGPITFSAVQRYQASQGIITTGYVGPLTRAAIGCGNPTPAPTPITLRALSPNYGPVGTTVSITGFGFTSDNTILFGSGAIVHVPVSSSIAIACTTDPSCQGGIRQTLVFTVPSALNPLCYYSGCMQPSQQTTPGAYAVSVKNTNGASNAVTFTVTGGTASLIPAISSLSPTSGPVGSSVTMYGSGFSSNDTVRIGGGAIGNTSVSSDGTQLTFTIPGSVGPYCPPGIMIMCPMYLRLLTPGVYQVSVENSNGTSNSLPFTVTSASSNTGPLSITGIDAPSTLAIGQTGTWSVHTSVASTAGQLHYSVVWGDEVVSPYSIMAVGAQSVQSTATFTHTYNRAGTYTPAFTVTDDAGERATVSITVLITPLY